MAEECVEINTLTIKQWVKEEITRKIRKYFDMMKTKIRIFSDLRKG